MVRHSTARLSRRASTSGKEGTRSTIREGRVLNSFPGRVKASQEWKPQAAVGNQRTPCDSGPEMEP